MKWYESYRSDYTDDSDEPDDGYSEYCVSGGNCGVCVFCSDSNSRLQTMSIPLQPPINPHLDVALTLDLKGIISFSTTSTFCPLDQCQPLPTPVKLPQAPDPLLTPQHPSPQQPLTPSRPSYNVRIVSPPTPLRCSPLSPRTTSFNSTHQHSNPWFNEAKFEQRSSFSTPFSTTSTAAHPTFSPSNPLHLHHTPLVTPNPPQCSPLFLRTTNFNSTHPHSNNWWASGSKIGQHSPASTPSPLTFSPISNLHQSPPHPLLILSLTTLLLHQTILQLSAPLLALAALGGPVPALHF